MRHGTEARARVVVQPTMALAALVSLVVGTPQVVAQEGEAVAEDCGKECVACWIYQWGFEGRKHSPDRGAYDMRCRAGNKCNKLGCPKGGSQEAVSELVPEDSDVLRLIQHATPETLPSLLAEYGSRLLIHQPRGLLAIRDDTCGTGIVSGVVFLSDERIRMLAQMKVTRIESPLQTDHGQTNPVNSQSRQEDASHV